MRKALLIICVLSLLASNSKSQTCNGWLKTPSYPSFIKVGDLDIEGSKLTIEAKFIRTSAWSGNQYNEGDLVSKHSATWDANYLLRPSIAQITTSNGYFETPAICPIELNKTYHIAMVYDGSTLKFYRNGVLMSQVAATGNLRQNDWGTHQSFHRSHCPYHHKVQGLRYI